MSDFFLFISSLILSWYSLLFGSGYKCSCVASHIWRGPPGSASSLAFCSSLSRRSFSAKSPFVFTLTGCRRFLQGCACWHTGQSICWQRLHLGCLLLLLCAAHCQQSGSSSTSSAGSCSTSASHEAARPVSCKPELSTNAGITRSGWVLWVTGSFDFFPSRRSPLRFIHPKCCGFAPGPPSKGHGVNSGQEHTRGDSTCRCKSC